MLSLNTGGKKICYYKIFFKRMLADFEKSFYIRYSFTTLLNAHVAGAWTVLKEMKPDATLEEVLSFLETARKPVTDFKSIITKPRIDLSRIDEFTQVVVSLLVEPSEVVLSQGKTKQLKFIANYSDGKIVDLNL